MTQTLTETKSPLGGWTSRHSGWAGIAFAVLLLAGILVGGNTPENDATDAEWTRWFEDSGNTRVAVLSIMLMLAAVVALIAFAAGLVQRLSKDQSNSRFYMLVVFGGAIVLGAATALGGITVGAMSGSIEFADMPVPDAGILRAVEQLGYGILLLGSGLGSLLLMGGTGLAARQNQALPAWLATASLVFGVGVFFGAALFVPLILLPVWVIAVSIVLLRDDPVASAR